MKPAIGHAVNVRAPGHFAPRRDALSWTHPDFCGATGLRGDGPNLGPCHSPRGHPGRHEAQAGYAGYGDLWQYAIEGEAPHDVDDSEVTRGA